jgi:dihydroxyacetone kinase-like predicted kinase
MGGKHTTIDGLLLKKMIASSSCYLDARKKEVDALNVFPVPDGDTGINMSLTYGSANKYAQKVTENSIGEVVGAASSGSLFGARGNSGVILSQLLRGMAKGLENLVQANAEQMARALQAGVDSAYKAVMRPVEGTILTVSAEMAKGAVARAVSGETDVVAVLRAGYLRGQQALKRTPDLLPALKQAGVVDAGGFGLLIIFEGWIACLEDRDLMEGRTAADASAKGAADGVDKDMVSREVSVGITEIADLEYPYCTEFLVKGERLDVEQIKRGLVNKGDSLLVVGNSQVVKIHVHTANPGRVLEYAIEFGSLHDVQINNMLSQNEAVVHERKSEGSLQNEEIMTSKVTDTDSALDSADSVWDTARARGASDTAGESFGPDGNNSETMADTLNAADGTIDQEFLSAGMLKNQESAPKKKYGLVAVAVGDGIAEIFLSLGADRIVCGGQTMNPSANDIVEAVKTIHAENVFVFPNNSNIIMAARLASDLLKEQKIIVIPSRSIAQGIAGMLEFSLSLDIDQNEQAMTKSLGKVGSGEVTYAVRDSQVNGFTINCGDVLGLAEGEIVAHGESIVAVTQQVLEELNWREKSLVTLFYGEEAQQTDVDSLREWLASEDDTVEAEIYEGKQPLYYFIIGVE